MVSLPPIYLLRWGVQDIHLDIVKYAQDAHSKNEEICHQVSPCIVSPSVTSFNYFVAFFTYSFAFLVAWHIDTNKPSPLSNRYINKAVTRRDLGCTPIPKQKGLLLEKIKDWVATTSKEQLKKLPEMLRATQLNHVAKELERALVEIEQQIPNCTVI